MTSEEKIEVLLSKINDLYVGLNQAYARISALEQQQAVTKPSKSGSAPKETPAGNTLGLTVETALQALDWSVETGVFHNAIGQFMSHYKNPQGDDKTAYQNIRNKIIGKAAPDNNARFGQEWLDYWSHNYLTKSGALRFSLGAYFMKICSMWRENNG